MQFQSPSAVHGPVRAPAEDEEPDAGGAAAGCEGAAGAGGEDAAAGGAVAVVGMMTGAEATGVDTGAEATGVDPDPVFVGWDAGKAGVGALLPEELEVDPPLDPPALPAGQVPTGPVNGPAPTFCTEAPGSGNSRSLDSLVLQPLPMLATNIGGNEAARSVKPGVSVFDSLFLLPPVTVTGAQFMYISRLPILLNHVHASV